jgi:chromosome segregation protein
LAYAADSLEIALRRRAELPPGAVIASREGHRVGRDTLMFNAPEKGHHGLIARVREIEGLEADLEMARERHGQRSTRKYTTPRRPCSPGGVRPRALQAQQQQLQGQAHQLQVVLVRSQEAARRVADRRAQIDRELEELYEQLDTESEAWNEASERLREARLEFDFARERLDEARQARLAADQHFQALREVQRRADRESQEALFQVRSVTVGYRTWPSA